VMSWRAYTSTGRSGVLDAGLPPSCQTKWHQPLQLALTRRTVRRCEYGLSWRAPSLPLVLGARPEIRLGLPIVGKLGA
jgi:hypothetical protein